MSVALRVADANEKTLARLRAQVGGQGKLVPAKEFVEGLLPEDQARLPGAVRKGFILVVWFGVVSNKSTGPTSAKFNYELGESIPAAYFSDRGRPFQFERSRHFSVIVADHGTR